MSTYINYGFLAAFVLGAYLIAHPVTAWFHNYMIKRSRTSRGRTNIDWKKYENLKLNRDLQSNMEMAGVPGTPMVLVMSSIVLAFVSYVGVDSAIQSKGSAVVAAAMMGSLPGVVLWYKIETRAQKLRMVMIPTVQNFLGFFTDSENLKSAIYRSSARMPYEMKPEWDRMVSDLHSGKNYEESIMGFANRVNNPHAHDFADVLMMHADHGMEITPSLFKLVSEMQNNSYNEERRNTLLAAYKWGTILMIVLAIVVVGYNCYLDPKAKYYYFQDPDGKKYITFSAVILFISFIAALSMGRRKM